MKLWRAFSRASERFSLRARLLSAFALIMALSLVPAVIVEETEEAAVEALDRIVQSDMRVSDLALRGIASFLNARRHEKDFLLYHREFGFREARARYVTQVQTSIGELQRQMRELREVGGDQGTREQTEQIERATSEYLANFLQTVELYELLGVPHRGLRAKLRDTLEALSPVTSSRYEPRLAAAYVDLYRAALEMMDDASPAEYERAIQELAAFERAAFAALPAQAKAQFAAQTRLFRETATGILEAATSIAEHRSAYLKAAQRVEPLLDTLHVTRVKAGQDALVAVRENGKIGDRYAIASGAVALIFTLILAIIIATRIGRGVDSLVAYTGKITEGHLDATAPAVRGKELGQLASALDTMTSRLRDSRDALELRNAQLAARHSEIVALGEMTNSLQACLNVDEAAEVIKRFCAAAFRDDCGAVYLFQSSRNYLEAIAIWGAGQPLPSFPPDDCWALRRGQTHRMIDATKDARCAHVNSEATAPLGYYCVPMSAQGNVLGLVHLEFGPGHANEQGDRLRLLSMLADQLALALANLKLRDSLRDQSIRDHLTGLHNRRFLEESLEREVARAKRTGEPLAVFMLDADHFKRFNDQFGHEVGDMVLAELGKTIKASCRRNDLACRYGGEEFTVVLSDAAGDAAMQWGERLLAKVRQLEVKTSAQSVGRITISAGVAFYPDHGEDVETLLQAADAALYQAKHAGRDRVAGYTANAHSDTKAAARAAVSG